MTLFQKIFQQFLRQFFKEMGREPGTPAEWMQIQDQAVRYLNKTKGAPSIKKEPFQGWNPRVIEGGKSKGGIEELIENEDIFLGKAPKTKKSTLDRKKEGLEGQINKEMWQKQKKAENKAAIERFKEKTKKKIDLSKYTDDDLNALANEHRILSAQAKKLGDAGENYKKFSQLNKRTGEIEEILDAAQDVPESGYGNIKADLALQKQKKLTKKKSVEDFRDEGDWDPGGMAYGGIAPLIGEPSYAADFYDDRTPMAGGKEVIEKSILTGPDTAIPPDIKKILDVIGGGAGIATIGLPKWLLSKLIPGGVRSSLAQKYMQLAKENRFRDARQLLTAQDPYVGEDPEMSEAKRTFRKYSRRVPTEEEEEFRLSPEMIEGGWRYPGRGGQGVPHEKDFAHGGRIGLAGGGAALKVWKKFVEKLFKEEMTKPTFRNLNPKNKEWAEGVVENYNKKMPALTKQFEEFKKTGELPKNMGVHKDYLGGYDTKKLRKKEVDYDYYREILDDAENDFVQGDETLETLEAMVKEQRDYHDDMYRQYMRGDLDKYVKPEVLEEQRLFRQKKIDEVLDKAYDEIAGGSGFSGDYKYDADVLSDSIAEQLGKGEFADLSKMYQTDIYNTALNRVTKNLKAKMDFKKGLKDVEEKIELQMFDPKDRLPNYLGGRIGYSGGGKAGLPAVTMGTPNLNMQGPQMPAGPQPAGISGANLQLNQMDLMQQQMQQNPWMQNQMQQGIGGMQQPQYGGQFRMPFGAGGMGRRAFMKLMAGITALPFVGKGGSKVAPKAVKETAEVITRGADGMPTCITDLIEVVKAKGTRDVIEGFKKSDYSTVHSYKGVDVIEDPVGNIKIKSDRGGVATDPYTGKTHEGIAQEHHMQIEKGEYVKNKQGEMVKSADEYVEGTVRPDMDGKMKDFEEGLDEDVHEFFKEIADEVDTIDQHMWSGVKSDVKKASGGVARLLGE